MDADNKPRLVRATSWDVPVPIGEFLGIESLITHLTSLAHSAEIDDWHRKELLADIKFVLEGTAANPLLRTELTQLLDHLNQTPTNE